MNLLWPVVRAGGKHEAAHQCQHTVLVSESNRDRRRSVYELLANFGYEVFATSNGADALLVCERFKGPIDLLLLGEDSPELRGATLIHQAMRIRPELQVLRWSEAEHLGAVLDRVRHTVPLVSAVKR
jgi:CheY-like chemotaxis protein